MSVGKSEEDKVVKMGLQGDTRMYCGPQMVSSSDMLLCLSSVVVCNAPHDRFSIMFGGIEVLRASLREIAYLRYSSRRSFLPCLL